MSDIAENFDADEAAADPDHPQHDLVATEAPEPAAEPAEEAPEPIPGPGNVEPPAVPSEDAVAAVAAPEAPPEA